MNISPLFKTVMFLMVMFGVIGSGISLAVLHKTDLDNRIRFSLTNHQGERLTEKDLQGQYLAVFFGFTNCPHICPSGMAKLSRVIYRLEQQDLKKRVKPIFISVDPERDTSAEIETFLESFHESFIGLRGGISDTQKITEQFNTIFKKTTQKKNGDYNVVHSSVIYIVDPYSRLVGYISNEADIDTAEQQLKEFL